MRYRSGTGTKQKTLANLQPGPAAEVEKLFINQNTDPFWQQYKPEEVFQHALETDPTKEKFYVNFLLEALGTALRGGGSQPFDWWNETGSTQVL